MGEYVHLCILFCHYSYEIRRTLYICHQEKLLRHGIFKNSSLLDTFTSNSIQFEEIMESVQFGSEVSDVQEELVRLNLKILSMIDSFNNIECQAEMDSLNGEIRAKLDLMRKGVENLRNL